jgi:spore coat polysaccharide biosynthesis predicted glycosyltransferase SpsG
MRVLFRCDGGPGIGVGHVVRCVALAEEAVARGHQVAFSGSISGDFLEPLLAGLGPRATLLGPVPDDRAETLAALASGYDVLHVDHYEVDPAVLQALGPGAVRREGGEPASARALLSNVCDGSFGARPADLSVDPTPGAEGNPAPAAATWSLRGGRFTPIRQAILQGRRDPDGPEAHAVPGGGMVTVLVVMGGTDPQACAPLVVDALAATGLDLDVTAIATSATEAGLRDRQASWAPGRLTVTLPVADLPERMAAADLVVTASGTSLWELCALRTPMAAVAVVENQRAGYDLVVDSGAAVGLGGPADLRDATTAAAALRPLLEDPAARVALAGRAARLVDGLGAWRVVSAWEAVHAGAAPARDGAAVRARPAALGDAETLWRWRNDPATRANSRSSEEVPWESHLAWLEASLTRDDRLLLVADDDSGPVGTVRWDHEGADEWEVSITVAPERRGQGLAAPLLAAGERALAEWAIRCREHGGTRRTSPGCTAYLAAVHVSNAASQRLFLGSGYLPELPPDDAGFARYLKPVEDAAG